MNALTKSRLTASLIGLVLLTLALLTSLGAAPYLSSFYQRLELLVYDLRMQIHLPQHVQPNLAPILIVDLDEESLHKYGRWPWSRSLVGQLTQELTAAGAAIIGFDILFGEPERNPAAEVLADLHADSNLSQELQALLPSFDRDQEFAQTLATSEAILGYVFHSQYDLTSGCLPTELPIDSAQVAQLALPKMQGYAAPLEVLTQQALSSGFFSLQPDADGLVRRAPLLARYDNLLYPSLALEMLRQFMLLEDLTLQTAEISGLHHLEAVQLASNLSLPTDGQGQLLVPFRGPERTFPYIPAWQVLDKTYAPETFTHALVLIGTSAPGLLDLRAIPLDAVYPGVEVHANILAAMLDKKFLQQPSWAAGANFVLALIAGLILALALPWLSAWKQLVLSVLVAAVVVFITGWLWVQAGIVLAVAAPLFLVVFSLALFNFVWGFVYESMTRNRLAFMFGQYVPPEIVAEMNNNPNSFSFAGEERELSVLFSDIRGFTTLSEGLSAVELKDLLNRYLTPITGVIFEQRGTIDKYIGDLVMAFWGAPLTDKDHALHSIQAAQLMLSTTKKLSAEFLREGLPAISVGIGINSGLMNVGDMGSSYRRAYTVLGDAVNLASRLESSTKYYGVDLIVGQRTQELTASHYIWRELDLVKVKGKTEPVSIYEPLGSPQDASPELLTELALYHQGLVAFRKQELASASSIFQQLAQLYPDTYIYKLYLERIEQLSVQPEPIDWDGSWARTDK